MQIHWISYSNTCPIERQFVQRTTELNRSVGSIKFKLKFILILLFKGEKIKLTSEKLSAIFAGLSALFALVTLVLSGIIFMHTLDVEKGNLVQSELLPSCPKFLQLSKSGFNDISSVGNDIKLANIGGRTVNVKLVAQSEGVALNSGNTFSTYAVPTANVLLFTDIRSTSVNLNLTSPYPQKVSFSLSAVCVDQNCKSNLINLLNCQYTRNETKSREDPDILAYYELRSS